MAHGSGFLAVYLAAMVLGNAKLPHWPATRGFADGLGWIAQIGMFVLLGLLVTPHDLVDDFWPARGRRTGADHGGPAAVGASSAWRPSGCRWREQALMSWAGLRGAVPIVLATIPMVSGIDGQPPDLQHRLRAGRRLHPDPGADAALAGPQDCSLGDSVGDRRPRHRVGAPGAAARASAVRRDPRRAPRCTASRSASCGCPPGAAVTLVVRDGKSFVPAAHDRAAPRGRTAGGGHRSGAGRGGAPAAGGRPGRQAGRLAGDRRERAGRRTGVPTGAGESSQRREPSATAQRPSLTRVVSSAEASCHRLDAVRAPGTRRCAGARTC